MKIYYLFDPLCGWCYGAKPALETVASQYPVELTPTGLFFRSGRVMDADFAQYAWGNDERIERLTGQAFRTAYRENVLQGGGQFDSQNSLLALTAVREMAPEQEIAVLSALQTARYVDGRDNADLSVIADILQTQGLGDIVPTVSDPVTEDHLLACIRFGQQLAQRLGVSGVPQLVIEHDGGWLIVPNQALYGDGQALLEYLGQFNDKNGA
ncbi:DsbA family protein [Moraxella pluranimalium]|uniref:Disulfide bond formation protein DsbA n=1 Tax=Moraxella pluranimalium TaxID=470453 RepID=A0A1T0CRS3_9GAMM|nr:DsbA family protein [Moraxella pluranimalium]OOS24861.1 disulfide bond formation protein DsbA [Moraxella pluranimalium]